MGQVTTRHSHPRRRLSLADGDPEHKRRQQRRVGPGECLCDISPFTSDPERADRNHHRGRGRNGSQCQGERKRAKRSVRVDLRRHTSPHHRHRRRLRYLRRHSHARDRVSFALRRSDHERPGERSFERRIRDRAPAAGRRYRYDYPRRGAAAAGGGNGGGAPTPTPTPTPTAATPITAATTTTTASGSSSSSGSGSGSAPSGSASASPVVFSPVVTKTINGKQAVTFTVQLGSSAALQITLVEQSGRTVLAFGTKAAKGRTRFTKNIPTLDLKSGSHLTLRIVALKNGKKHTTSVPVKL